MVSRYRANVKKFNEARITSLRTIYEKKVHMKSIRDAMSKVIFPYLKFVPKDHIKSIAKGSLGAKILTELDVEESDWPTFWASHYEITENLLTEHRSKVAQHMKKTLEKGKSNLFQ